MSKITLQDLVNLENETSAVTLINDNSTIIQDAFDNTLSLDGTAPNQMQAVLDMNSNQVLNLPAPSGSASPLRLQDLSTFVGGGTVTNIPAGGTSGQFLEKNSNSDFDVKWATTPSGSGTVTSVGLSLPSEFTVTNSPVTSTGTLTATKATQTANTVYAGPTTGSAAAPTFRAQVAADLPTIALTGNVTGSASGGSIATTIGANQVTNAMHATQADSTIKSNISGSTGTPSDNTITTVLDKQFGTVQGSVVYRGASSWAALGPGTSGQVLQSGGTSANPSWLTSTGSGTVTQVNTSGMLVGGPITTSGTLAVNVTFPPCGRLTLTTSVPVMSATVSASTSIFYTPYKGNVIPIYDGSNMNPTVFTELTNSTTDTTKNPAAVAANSVYDLFVWNDSGTVRLSRGPVWTNVQTRSTGTALARTNGILLNSVSITNGPAANRGTYVGTVASNGTSTIDYILGTPSSGGGAAFIGVWNMYNRTMFGTEVIDNGGSYTYTSATIRQARASTGNQISFVQGLAEDSVWGAYTQRILTAAVATASGAFGLALNSSTGIDGQSASIFAPTAAVFAGATSISRSFLSTTLGLNVMFANEGSDGTNANTFNAGGAGTLNIRLFN